MDSGPDNRLPSTWVKVHPSWESDRRNLAHFPSQAPVLGSVFPPLGMIPFCPPNMNGKLTLQSEIVGPSSLSYLEFSYFTIQGKMLGNKRERNRAGESGEKLWRKGNEKCNFWSYSEEWKETMGVAKYMQKRNLEEVGRTVRKEFIIHLLSIKVGA